jgi:hypothetical protein
MASPTLPANHLTAGGDYLAAMDRLGLRPMYLGWGWETTTSQWVLVLVTSILDAGGPLALNRLLFQAYNAEVTPRAVSPFIVRIFSPEIVPKDLYMLGEKNLMVTSVKDKFGNPKPMPKQKVQDMNVTFLGIELQMTHSYQTLPQSKKKYHERRNEWQKFKRNVERLAA